MTPGAYYYYSDYSDYQDMVLSGLLEDKGEPVLFKGFTNEAVRIIARDNLIKAVSWLNDQYGKALKNGSGEGYITLFSNIQAGSNSSWVQANAPTAVHDIPSRLRTFSLRITSNRHLV